MWSMFGKWLKFTPDWRAFLGRQQPLPGHSHSSEPCAGENPSAVIRTLLWSGAKVPGVVGAGQGGCWSFLGSPTSDHSVIFFITVLVCKTRQESLIGLCLTLVTWTGGIRKYSQMLSLSLKNNGHHVVLNTSFQELLSWGKKWAFFFCYTGLYLRMKVKQTCIGNQPWVLVASFQKGFFQSLQLWVSLPLSLKLYLSWDLQEIRQKTLQQHRGLSQNPKA